MTDDRRPVALEDRETDGARLFSPSAARNRDVIRDAFLAHMPQAGIILEVGSGSGEHAAHIAAAAPGLDWRPSDPDAPSRASIAAWTHHFGLENVAPPIDVDVTRQNWSGVLSGGEPADGVVSVNMIHIAPFAAAEGLIAGAGAALRSGGRLFLYGPFARDGFHTAASNEDFDRSLKARNPGWGVRDLDREIAPLAKKASLDLAAVVAMPANNFSVIFQRR